jgi:integrase
VAATKTGAGFVRLLYGSAVRMSGWRPQLVAVGGVVATVLMRRLWLGHDYDPRPRPTERRSVVDLHDPRTLAAVSDYVMTKRPRDCGSPFLFLVGGAGLRRWDTRSCGPVSPAAARGGYPHTVDHAARVASHARDRDVGARMRELTLQKRLGHASPESTQMYTRVLADYQAATDAIARRRSKEVR